MGGVYRIGDFAEKIGRSASTVRRWESEGRILSRWSPSSQRFFTPHRVVKQIVPARADRHRTRLPVPDSSPARQAESETSINAHAQV